MTKRIALALGVAALLAGGAAHAALVKQDLLTAGDGLITLDTVTHLEWLNLTATQDLSVEQVLGGAGGWVGSGFEYASFGQVGQMLNDAGYLGSTSDYSSLQLVADNTSANAFLADFGSTSPPNFTFGFMAPFPCGRTIGTDTICTDYVQINANGAANMGYAIPDSESLPHRRGAELHRQLPGPFGARARNLRHDAGRPGLVRRARAPQAPALTRALAGDDDQSAGSRLNINAAIGDGVRPRNVTTPVCEATAGRSVTDRQPERPGRGLHRRPPRRAALPAPRPTAGRRS